MIRFLFPPGRARAVALLALGLTGCSGERAATGARPPTIAGVRAGQCADEVLYAGVYSTRKHQLAGQNPIVGLFYSRDGGATWTQTGWTQGHAFAAMATPGGCGDTVFVANGNGVHRTTNGGRFWRITTGWDVTEVQDVTMDPSRPWRVFAATPYGLFVTSDLGQTWRAQNDGLASRFVASVRVDRTAPDRVFAGTEAGLFVSPDGGRSWRATAVTAPVRSIRQSQADPRRWAVGLQDSGIALSTDGGTTWTYASGEPATRTIYEAEFHPSESSTIYAGGWGTGVLVSRDFGRTWTTDVRGLDEKSVHALAVSRRHRGVVYAGTLGGGLFVSRDDGRTWTAVAPEHFEAAQIWDLYVEGEQ
ncbi:MAG TPA: hypothetical protein VD948_05625 [Rhodothermales bacterium]|nr:hypothetical protein [Rhodothermales bacterium]